MKEKIIQMIRSYVEQYQNKAGIITTWKEPLIGFADAKSEEFIRLRELVLPDHQLPEEILDSPTVVISYFIPFTENIGKSNESGEPGQPSELWATAYDETNEMMACLNRYLAEEIHKMGYHAQASQIAGEFSEDVLKSRWSQRHVARIAGLGTFGLNNMLITELGCCGRYQSIVSNIPVDPDRPLKEERCLYKYNGTCKLCTAHCTAEALTLEGFDRFRCYSVCSTGTAHNVTCGKCVVNLPCTFQNPGRNHEKKQKGLGI